VKGKSDRHKDKHSESGDDPPGRPGRRSRADAVRLARLALEPRDLRVGVAGPPAVATTIEQRLAAKDGVFEIHRYADEAAARAAIEERDVYGAFVQTSAGAELLTASGASPTVAQLLREAGGAGDQSGQAGTSVRDVVPAAEDDPRGTGLAASVFPLVLVGLAGIVLAPGLLRRATLVLAGSIIAGLAAIAVAQGWLGIVEHNWAANWAVLSLVVLSIASAVAGLEALVGRAGIGLGAATMVLVGNPLSAVSSAPELLLQPLGAIGQLLPPGAGGSLLRSTAFFDGAAAGGYVAVLAAWVLVGLTANLAAAMRSGRVPLRPIARAYRVIRWNPPSRAGSGDSARRRTPSAAPW
jgi:hypothetical protein